MDYNQSWSIIYSYPCVVFHSLRNTAITWSYPQKYKFIYLFPCHMDFPYDGFLKWGLPPKSSMFRISHNKPSIFLGTPHLRKPPCVSVKIRTICQTKCIDSDRWPELFMMYFGAHHGSISTYNWTYYTLYMYICIYVYVYMICVYIYIYVFI